MSAQELDAVSNVYLEGDSAPLETPLSPEAVASRIYETCHAASGLQALWVRIPLTDGRDALIRPRVIVAIVPEKVD